MFLNILNGQNNLIYNTKNALNNNNNNISSDNNKKEVNFIENDIINDLNKPIDVIVNDLPNYSSNSYTTNDKPIDVIVNDLPNYNTNDKPIDVIVNDINHLDLKKGKISTPKTINVFKTCNKDIDKYDRDIKDKCDKDIDKDIKDIKDKCDKDIDKDIKDKCDKDIDKCDKDIKDKCDKDIKDKCDKDIKDRCDKDIKEQKLQELLLFNNQINNKYFISILILTIFGALIFIINAYTNKDIVEIEVYYDRGVTLVWYIILGIMFAILTAHMVYKPYILDSYNNGKKVLYALIFYELAYMYWSTTLFKSRVERGLALVASVFLVAATIWLGWVCYHYDKNTIYIFILLLLFSLYLQIFTIYVAHAPWKQFIGTI